MSVSGFDYGNKKADGQYERHPGNLEGKYVAPIRWTYTHNRCGGVATRVPHDVAHTYAKHPTFYGRTFCVGCGDYFPIQEFRWDDGVTVGDIGTEECYRKKEPKTIRKRFIVDSEDIHPDDFDPEEMVSVEQTIFGQLNRFGYKVYGVYMDDGLKDKYIGFLQSCCRSGERWEGTFEDFKREMETKQADSAKNGEKDRRTQESTSTAIDDQAMHSIDRK